jgi:uncharacterized membrane protein YtjA (UPF0391 family)
MLSVTFRARITALCKISAEAILQFSAYFENPDTPTVIAHFDSVLMLSLALILLITALVGFGGFAVATAGGAKFVFFILLVTCLIFLILSMWQAEEPNHPRRRVR